MKLWKLAVAACLISFNLNVFAGDASLFVDIAKPGIKVSPTLYGIFFEEINRSGDGGIYAEMINNRSFEDADTTIGWNVTKSEGSSATIDNSQPIHERNPHSLRVEIPKAGGSVTLANEGFKGMSVVQGEKYVASFYARCDESFDGPIALRLETSNGQKSVEGKIDGVSKEWKKFEVQFLADDTDAHAKFVVGIKSPGVVWLDMVSLFPGKTWKDRAGGLRNDLAQMVDDLKPGFVRFPGGCWVEGETLRDAYRWKNTIGDVSHRKSIWNLWKYVSTNGLGYHEYLQWCEDLGAEPLFVVNCGMSHQEQRQYSDRNRESNLPDLNEYLQDALDAIEYANGGPDTKWGAERVKNGHPAPFGLKYMEIGNENGGPVYHARYAMFYDAIKKQYPDMHLIANVWHGVPRNRPTEIIDEHYYNTPGFFFENADRYDAYDRNGAKIYVGEYAVTQRAGKGNLIAAVGEAAFMTGMERNSDVVVMASYAPLFTHVDYKVWNPDAINFDASRAYGTPSYWVQQMFGANRADVILPVKLDAKQVEQKPHRGAVGIGTWVTQAEFKDLKVEKDGKALYQSDFSKGMSDVNVTHGEWKVVDGALRQTSNDEGCLATVGDPSWEDYTYSVKARKISGTEGFLIPFHWADGKNFTMLNLGGWRNTKHGIEQDVDGGRSQVSRQVNAQIDTDKWYDIRIEVKGDAIKAYLDGKLVQEMKYSNPKTLFAVAGRAGDDVIVKVVNGGNKPQTVALQLDGAASVDSKAKVIEISGNPSDENTLDEPTKVAPRKSEIQAGSSFTHEFPACSVTILRLKAK